jgi:histidinol phosphatase-like PHP family hydrolase
VTVVPGVEVVILNQTGEVSIGVQEAKLVRWVLADFGSRTEGIGNNPPASVEGFMKNVEAAICGAAANPVVDAIAHPFNLGRFPARANPEDLPRDMVARIADAMAGHGCAFELMNQAFWWHPEISVAEYVEQMVPVIQVFAEAGVDFVVGSDAHSSGAVGNLAFSQRLMTAAGLGRDHLIDLEALNERRRWEQAHGRRLE